MQSPLLMTSNFPTEHLRSSGGILAASVTITNTSNRRIVGETDASPNVSVLQSGKVVARPLGRRAMGIVIDLRPGESMSFPAGVRLSATTGGDSDLILAEKDGVKQPIANLPPGLYELMAAQKFDLQPDVGEGFQVEDIDPDSGYTLTVTGGPWELTLR